MSIYNVRIAGDKSPFYVSTNPILIKRMWRMLMEMGYTKATMMKYGNSLLPLWGEEEIDEEICQYFGGPIAMDKNYFVSSNFREHLLQIWSNSKEYLEAFNSK